MNLKDQYEANKMHRRSAFHGSIYMYKGARIIGVCQLLGGDVWGVCWISESGARKRIKSVRLPVLADPEALQRRLDAWAIEHDLLEVTSESI